MTSSSCSLESTYRYSDIGVRPSSAATDFIDTPSSPSRSATATPAAPISWMVRPGLGPRRPAGSRSHNSWRYRGSSGSVTESAYETACAIHTLPRKFCVHRQQLTTYADREHLMTARAGRREWIGLAVLILPILIASMDVSVLFFAVP